MSPGIIFALGLLVLALFGWYFMEEDALRKKISGLTLTLLLVVLCVSSFYPPFDVRDAAGKVVTPGKLRLGLDLEGGTAFQVRLRRESNEAPITKDMQEQAVEVIRSRVDNMGTGEPIISPVGEDQILVQIPGLSTSELDNVRLQLQRVAKLEFKLVHPQSEQVLAQVDAGQTIVPPGYRIDTEAYERGGKQLSQRLLIKSRADITGDKVSAAYPFYDVQGWGVSLKFDSVGAKQFGELTAANIGNRLAIVLDNKIISAPVLQSAIYGGTAQITGRFKEKEVRDLASALENPLQTPVKVEEERSVSASLGSDSIKSGVLAGLVGVLATFIAAAIYYRLAGLIANIALLVNIILLFGAMTQFHFVLTLPGIAGIVLTIGMAIDANVLIYERLREEMAAGKGLRAALEGAYSKAFSSIFDANVTTLITSVILFALATGPVKGFAVTLTVGIICSLFTALLVTRNIFSWGLDNLGLKKLTMASIIPTHGTWDFMGRAKICIGASLAVILLSVGAFALHGKDNFGIDFRGGDLLVLSSQKPVSTQEVRDVLGSIKLAESTVQIESKEGLDFINIRSDFDTSPAIVKTLNEKFADRGLKIEKAEKVGALVGGELARRSIYALLLGMVGIFIYVAVRFETSFAVGAIVALVHDVIITVGVFAILGKEMSLIMVGAVLTIAGYSINDTIVVYDRIRSSLRDGHRGSISDIMNQAINETLSRTLLTSSLTLLTVLALLFLGGPVLNVFALAMLVGIVVGTYSSIFIASPIVLWFAKLRHGGLREEIKRSEVSNPNASPAKV